MNFCHKCGEKINRNQKFCINCGADLMERKIQSIEEGFIECENCGHYFKSHELFCLNCGFLLRDYSYNLNLDEIEDIESLIDETNDDFDKNVRALRKTSEKTYNEIELIGKEFNKLISELNNGLISRNKFEEEYDVICINLSRAIENKLNNTPEIDFKILNNLDILNSLCIKNNSKRKSEHILKKYIKVYNELIETCENNISAFYELDRSLYSNANHVNIYIKTLEKMKVYEKALVREAENIKNKRTL